MTVAAVIFFTPLAIAAALVNGPYRHRLLQPMPYVVRNIPFNCLQKMAHVLSHSAMYLSELKELPSLAVK